MTEKQNPDTFNPIGSAVSFNSKGVDFWRLNQINKIEAAIKAFNAGTSEHRTARALAIALYDETRTAVVNQQQAEILTSTKKELSE